MYKTLWQFLVLCVVFAALVMAIHGLDQFLRPQQAAQRFGLPTTAPRVVEEEFPPVHGDRLIYVNRVVDGDTVDFFYLIPARGRLRGINAPEKGSPNGDKAKEWLQLQVQGSFLDSSMYGKDKYGRVLVELRQKGGDPSWNDRMLELGIAKPYDGKGKRPE